MHAIFANSQRYVYRAPRASRTPMASPPSSTSSSAASATTALPSGHVDRDYQVHGIAPRRRLLLGGTGPFVGFVVFRLVDLLTGCLGAVSPRPSVVRPPHALELLQLVALRLVSLRIELVVRQQRVGHLVE